MVICTKVKVSYCGIRLRIFDRFDRLYFPEIHRNQSDCTFSLPDAKNSAAVSTIVFVYDTILTDYPSVRTSDMILLNSQEEMEMNGFVSIIVPVYNVAQYLDRCLTSLANQTYQNIEIILVDDGSTDNSGTLCDVWQTRDDRIKVYHKSNGGLSDARNYGMQRATGDYICFVDSDDWIDLKYIEVMLGALVDTGSDIAQCDYLCTDGIEPVPDNRQTVCGSNVFEGKECFRRFLSNDFSVIVCDKLYRTSILKDQPFLKGVYHEDESWTYKIFSKVQKACRLNYIGYYYYQRHGSIIHTKPSVKRITDAFVAGKDRIDFIELHYPEYASIGYSKMMYTCMYLFNEIKRSDIPQKHTLQEDLISYFRIILKKYLKRRQYQKEMWRFLFFRLFPNHYCKISY